MDIKDLPIKLQELCFKRQREQGNYIRFSGSLINEASNNNFTWNKTLEGNEFWSSIYQGNIPKEYIELPNENFNQEINNFKFY